MPLVLPTAHEYEAMLSSSARRAAVARLVREHHNARTRTRTAIRAAQAVADTEALYQQACVIFASIPRDPEVDIIARRRVLETDYQHDAKGRR